MIRHTANYSNTNHNFVIQNVKETRVDSDIVPAVCIIKNILQRGKPTKMSSYLKQELGEIHLRENFNTFLPLISVVKPAWERIIRGDIKGNYNPAKYFFDVLIPKYFPEYPFLQQLIIPEIPINFITQIEVDHFMEQQVDFYLPQALLVIEIDGSQHDSRVDNQRDAHLKKFGNETYRFSTKDIESEGENFQNTISRIKNRILKTSQNISEKYQSDSTIEFIPTIDDYTKIYSNQIESNDPRIIATSIIRFQILLLDLLEFGHLDLNKTWNIELKTDIDSPFEKLAIQDVKMWLENILQLHKVKINFPSINVSRVNEFSEKRAVCIDFSIYKRYTDEFQNHPEIIFVRTDYFDHHLFYKATNAINPEIVGFKPFDFYKISTCEPVNYKLIFQQQSDKSDEKTLGYVLNNLFGYSDFRDGQLPIIANALALNSTIGLLPTGGGKSICFQLPVFLQPGISFVICPIKALMFDQKVDLNKNMITRIEHVTSEDDAARKDLILNDFSNGKYQFIFIAPERFQIKSFRQYLQKLRENFTISYAVIDEVHCLSEWGHDFRTSYLNLSKTVQKYCSGSVRFLALTATASLNVLKDIKLELKIRDENVKTLTDYSRAELEFEVISDQDKKYNVLKGVLEEESERNQIFDSNGDNSNAGIIFTPTVNGHAGCANIARALSEYFKISIEFFSGSAPKINGNIQENKSFEEYKHDVQQRFKSNDLQLIVATKAFGMGVNKKNVSYTIHYGIPGSMESLYQEAGRAGRDKERYLKNHAKCYVLFTENRKAENLSFLWDQNTSVFELKKRVNDIDGDLKSNLFMLQSSLEEESSEFSIIKEIILKYAVPNKKEVLVESKNIRINAIDAEGNELEIGNKAFTEKAIYRLTQLGIVEDWTVKDFFKGEFEVDFSNYSESSVKDALMRTISKYSDKNVLDNLVNQQFELSNGESVIDKSIRVLLNWVNKHFVYNRRQSLKNIYEACANYEFGDANTRSLDFKNVLENYFKFNESSYVLQHISENSFDYEKWFEVFYMLITEGQKQYRTDEVLNEVELKNLQGNLARFLESYANNVGLNYISGLVRLMNNEFENSDGKNRLDLSFNYLIDNEWKLGETEVKVSILTKTCKIVRSAKIDTRNVLAKYLIDKIGTDLEAIKLINQHLEDDLSTTYLLKQFKKRLITVNKNINEQFERIG
jgi:ATP-dependent DNA helicase RecQ